MKKCLLIFLGVALISTLGISPALAGKPVDNDGDGVKSNSDCNDNDPLVWDLNSCGECAPEPAGGCGGGCTPTEPSEVSCADGVDNDCDTTIDCADGDCASDPACNSGGGGETAPKNAFNIMMNYELGMHCTGFEFSYCCILPPYNSILAQVVKTEKNGNQPALMEADHNVGVDGLGRPTVVRDKALDSDGNFKKYQLRYWHDAQPRNDGRGAPQTSTLISNVEGNSLMMWNTVQDSYALGPNGEIVYDANGVAQGDGDFDDPTDNYANAWLNHFYIYADLEGSNPNNSTLEADKIRLGVEGHVMYPENAGAALHPMGPGNTDVPFGNVLTFSGDTGTVVYTQMKVLENLPIMLTAPGIWEALGLPLTPFEDSINFFGDPGAVDEDTIRPYVIMRAQLEDYATGEAILDDGQPVQGFGTAPIDIPNCERCHGITSTTAVNSAQKDNATIVPLVEEEISFWNAYYNIDTNAGDSDWYSRIKGAAISILAIHDAQHGTSFTANWPVLDGGNDQKTRLGGPSIICQRCHADNVIAVVKSAYTDTGQVIMPLTEAIHNNHKANEFDDALARNGSCQGCHPAHRSDGSMETFPIDAEGNNTFANGDNRDSFGGCYVGRDVHVNPGKDGDGAETPSHMNAMGEWLVDNVANDTGTWKGIWCTNCHSQFGQELWKAENVESLVHAQPGDPGHVREPFAGATLADVAAGIGVSEAQAIAWLDPKTTEDAFAVWARDPGLCDHVGTLFGAPANPAQDGFVATIEVAIPGFGQTCSAPVSADGPDCDGDGAPDFFICGSVDADGDFSVNALDFCTTADCVEAAQATLANSAAVPVPMSAATDGRDHWLAPGEPHCADCHAAPYVEQSGNISAYPPFNYPKKASLFRYTKGHQGITCQGCHESTHGLYPVTPDIDTTTYAQAASMNTDGSHGPLKCGACHDANADGVNKAVAALDYQGQPIGSDFDAAVSWAHTYTEEADPRTFICLRCHSDNSGSVASDNGKWTNHANQGRVSRASMDKVEIAQLGHVAGDPDVEDPYTTVCTSCHGDRTRTLARKGCTDRWKNHLISGRASESVWEFISVDQTGTTCGY